LASPWVRRRKIALAELVDQPWCLPPLESFPGSWIAKTFHARGLEVPRARVTVYSAQMLQALCATGRFLGIALDHAAFQRQAAGAQGAPGRYAGADVAHRNRHVERRTPNPAMRLFIECAQDVAKPLANKR
jgi:DNA-binding transcriptional LysR family regulator